MNKLETTHNQATIVFLYKLWEIKSLQQIDFKLSCLDGWIGCGDVNMMRCRSTMVGIREQ